MTVVVLVVVVVFTVPVVVVLALTIIKLGIAASEAIVRNISNSWCQSK